MAASRSFVPLGLPPKRSPERALYEHQRSGADSTFSFDIKGDAKNAFAFLNALKVFNFAVSLGGTVTGQPL